MRLPIQPVHLLPAAFALAVGAGAVWAGYAYGYAHDPVVTRYVPVVSTRTIAPEPPAPIRVQVPGPAVTVYRTRYLPGPVRTVTAPAPPPAPAVTVTVTEPAPQPPQSS